MPENFFIAKGEAFRVNLLNLVDFKESKEQKFPPALTSTVRFYDGSKKEDIKISASDSLPLVTSRKLENSGLILLTVEQNTAESTHPKKEFLNWLRENGLDQLEKMAKAKSKDVFIKKNLICSKTLAMADKPSGGLFNQKTGLTLEIVLQQNPYKMQYGDDMTAEILFKGKPHANGRVDVLTIASNGAVFKQNYSTDKGGRIYFKLNRAGSWMIRTIHMLPLQDGNIDFESFSSNYTFGFR